MYIDAGNAEFIFTVFQAMPMSGMYGAYICGLSSNRDIGYPMADFTDHADGGYNYIFMVLLVMLIWGCRRVLSF